MIQASRMNPYGMSRDEFSQGSQYQSSSIFGNDEENSLHNTYGFKQNEVSIQDVFKFNPPLQSMVMTENQIELAQMQNGKIWVLTRRNKVIGKMNLENKEDKPPEVDDDILKRKPIKKMFVDHKGIHCFFLAEHEIYYNHWGQNRVFAVPTSTSHGVSGQNSQPKAFKSIDLQYVQAADLDTFEILLGTDDGQIFHACLQYSPKGLQVIDPLCCVLETNDFRPILDIKMAKVLSRQLVFAITDSSLHQFISENNLKKTFMDYANNPKLMQEHSIRIDASTSTTSQDNRDEAEDINFNQLKLYTNYQNNQIGGFGWMNEYGFAYAGFNVMQGDFIVKKKGLTMIKYLKKEGDSPVENQIPNSFAITQFHIVFMYPKNVTILSKISNEIVFSRNFENQELQGVCLDMNYNRLMMYGKVQPVFIAYLKGEDQDAWKYYLKKGMIIDALNNCKNTKQKAFVAGIYADQLFEKEKYEKAADYYAKSEKTFEEVTLKFLKANLYIYLENYLQKILEKIDKNREDLQPQRMLLCTWIVELKLNEINNCQAQLESKKDDQSVKAASETISLLQTEFHDFLLKNAKDIHQDTVFQVLQSHGKINECIKFAEDTQSYETVIVHYINKQEYELALKKVHEISDEKTRNNIMLRYASVFIKNLPIKTIEVLKSFKSIDIPKLIPAFMNIPKGKAMDEALHYVLEYCIKRRKSREKTVHNLAFYFYAEREKPDELLDYLKMEEAKKHEGHAIFFEVDYALNVCKQKEKEMSEKRKLPGDKDADEMIKKMKKAQIILYAILNLHDKAVKLSLECQDIDMAKEYANKPSDKKMKKKLWMKIAKYLFNYQSKKSQGAGGLGTSKMLMKAGIIGGSSSQSLDKRGPIDVTKALDILKDSILKIDDLLPLFPEEAKVEDMKKHLCECLDQYNNKIQDLKQQLEEHSKNAEILRKQQRKQRHKHITINPSQMCDICFTSIFKKEFYVFPCLHAFHRECVYKQIKNYETKDPKIRTIVDKIKSLFGEIENIKMRAVFIQSNVQGSMFGGSGSNYMTGGFDDENKKSLISDIKNYFTKSYRAGMTQGIGSQTNQILQQKDQEDIRRIYNKIDDILTRECFYCGGLLIDMIDNDVFTDQNKDYEFFNQDEAQQIANIGDEDWKIR